MITLSSIIIWLLICTGCGKRAGMISGHAAAFPCLDALQGFLRLFYPLLYKHTTATQKAVKKANRGIVGAYYDRIPYTASRDASDSRDDDLLNESNYD